MPNRNRVLFLFIFVCCCWQALNGFVVELNPDNIDEYMQNNRIIFVNFYVNWCHYSNLLTPIFLESSKHFENSPSGQIVWAAIDCQQYPLLGQRYMINKYPTLKVFVYGEMTQEYRLARSVDALIKYVDNLLIPHALTFDNEQLLSSQMDKSQRNFIAKFIDPNGLESNNYRKISEIDRNVGIFWIYNQSSSSNEIIYYPPHSNMEVFQRMPDDNIGNYNSMKLWIQERSIPVVRELTFENVEHFTEEGRPFLILFRRIDADDRVSIEQQFSDVVTRDVQNLDAVNCFFADGIKFAHPLKQLGKDASDLPIIAADTFEHMFVFDYSQLDVPGKLRQFVLDIQSGKLHRDYHAGALTSPSPQQMVVTTTEPIIENNSSEVEKHTQDLDVTTVSSESSTSVLSDKSTTKKADDQLLTEKSYWPSVFKLLKPSDRRYTIVRDEL